MRQLLGISKRDWYGVMLPGAIAILAFAWAAVSFLTV